MSEEKSWKDDLPEDVKDSSELSTFKDVAALAKSYVTLSKSFSKNHEAPGKDDNFETFSEKTGKFFGIGKREEYKTKYEGDNKKEIEDLAHKYRLAPIQIQGFMEDYKKHREEVSKAKIGLRNEKWEKENKENFKEITNKDELLGKALNSLGTDAEKMKATLKDQFENPAIKKLLVNMGKALSEAEKQGKKGEHEPSGGGGTGDDSTIEEKLQFVRGHFHNKAGAFWDKSKANHVETRMKVNRYVSELSQHQAKTGKKMNLMG